MCRSIARLHTMDDNGKPITIVIVECPNCGEPVPLEDDYNFCVKCGTDIDRNGNVIPTTDLEIGAGTVGR